MTEPTWDATAVIFGEFSYPSFNSLSTLAIGGLVVCESSVFISYQSWHQHMISSVSSVPYCIKVVRATAWRQRHKETSDTQWRTIWKKCNSLPQIAADCNIVKRSQTFKRFKLQLTLMFNMMGLLESSWLWHCMIPYDHTTSPVTLKNMSYDHVQFAVCLRDLPHTVQEHHPKAWVALARGWERLRGVFDATQWVTRQNRVTLSIFESCLKGFLVEWLGQCWAAMSGESAHIGLPSSIRSCARLLVVLIVCVCVCLYFLWYSHLQLSCVIDDFSCRSFVFSVSVVWYKRGFQKCSGNTNSNEVYEYATKKHQEKTKRMTQTSLGSC